MDEESRQQIVDDEQLRILKMGYFVSAGMLALVSLLVLAYTFAGFFIFSRLAQSPGGNNPPAFVGQIIGFIGLAVLFLMWGIALLQFLTGRRLKDRRSRTFCMVIAGLTCLSFPYGTFLGVCTFIVLSRPTVSKLFAESSH